MIVAANCKTIKDADDKTIIVILAANLFRDVVEVKEDVECGEISDQVAPSTIPAYKYYISFNMFSLI